MLFRSQKRYRKVEWKDVIVGDFIHLSCNEIIPADVLLVRSSDPLGICHVETSNLDGESNLKQRQVVNSMHKLQTNVCFSNLFAISIKHSFELPFLTSVTLLSKRINEKYLLRSFTAFGNICLVSKLWSIGFDE